MRTAIQLHVAASVTYERVTTIQRNVSAAMQLYEGFRELWGVLHAP